jgi:hypothetical protein
MANHKCHGAPQCCVAERERVLGLIEAHFSNALGMPLGLGPLIARIRKGES